MNAPLDSPKASIDRQDLRGRMPLHEAVRFGRPGTIYGMVALLPVRGAGFQPGVSAWHGRSPGDQAVLELLAADRTQPEAQA